VRLVGQSLTYRQSAQPAVSFKGEWLQAENG